MQVMLVTPFWQKGDLSLSDTRVDTLKHVYDVMVARLFKSYMHAGVVGKNVHLIL